MATRILKIALAYLLIGATMGVVMGVTRQFQYAPVHAHINLLGWASLALVGVLYRLHPDAARTALARWHFWLHNLGLPLFMVSLFLLLSGHAWAGPIVGAGAITTLAGLALFAVNVVRTLNATERQEG